MLEQYSDILSFREVCEILSLGRSTVYKLLKQGTFKSMKVGKAYRITKQSIIEYFNEQKEKEKK